MGLTSETVITITCDNPACPGNSLDPASQSGWIQIQASVTPVLPEGSTGFVMPIMAPTQYFCSPACAGSVEQALVAAEEAREAAANPPELENELPEPEAKTRAKR